MRTIDIPEPNEIDSRIRKRKGQGNYQKTLAYLTERKIVLDLTAGPHTFTQIQKKTKVQKQTLGKNLDKFTKEGCVHKHKISRGILEHQRGQPEYYVLNFSHIKVDEYLNGPYPDFVRKTFEAAVKPKKSISEFRKHLPIIYGLVGYNKSPYKVQENPSYDIKRDLDRSVRRDPRYYEMVNKAYRNEQIQRLFHELKKSQEEKLSIEENLWKSRMEYEKNLDDRCLRIGSLVTGTFGLTVWDALILCMDSLGFSDPKYRRIWNLFQSSYPNKFVFK